MLNCCIERKKAREEMQRELNFDSAEGSSTDDDEFFDCADKPVEEVKRIQPSGRLGKFQNLKLIETGENLYIPVTQEPVPKTEDQLDEDADVLLKLGSDAQGSELRAKMMSASLLSDMESFKAANPGAILEDFVRWYSPRDWQEIDEEDQWGQKKGKLSTRMLIEDNIWAQMWKSAKPVPANKQKLLFVDTKEAEKVLHFLESRTLSQISELLTPILLQASIYRLAEEVMQVQAELIDGTDKLQNVIKLSERISRDDKVSVRRVEAVVQEMAQLELNMSEINSLHYKLNPSGERVEDLRESVRSLANGKEIGIDKNSEIGNRLYSLFGDAQRNANLMKEEIGDEGKIVQGNVVFPAPNEREFVMRVQAVKPAIYSGMCPQYLRAILSKNEFRLAGAFAEDISFLKCYSNFVQIIYYEFVTI
ncbi:hypothetical protein HHI36_004633 [Cryptolaemus montrouzieri]|uniref:Rab3 GTPase-activating protein catalytic subunit n=1 Tax=Cryptolaemus montrouzieri TaxID=559131 RepID=A0ABD2NS17_9CUCU